MKNALDFITFKPDLKPEADSLSSSMRFLNPNKNCNKHYFSHFFNISEQILNVFRNHNITNFFPNRNLHSVSVKYRYHQIWNSIIKQLLAMPKTITLYYETNVAKA